MLIAVVVGLVCAAVAGVAVYLHQSAGTQAKIDAAVSAAVADAKKAAVVVQSKV